MDVFVWNAFLVRYITSGNVSDEEGILDGKDADGKNAEKDEEQRRRKRRKDKKESRQDLNEDKELFCSAV